VERPRISLFADAAAHPDAGIGPRNIEETLAIEIANPDVFDRRSDAGRAHGNGRDGDQ